MIMAKRTVESPTDIGISNMTTVAIGLVTVVILIQRNSDTGVV